MKRVRTGKRKISDVVEHEPQEWQSEIESDEIASELASWQSSLNPMVLDLKKQKLVADEDDYENIFSAWETGTPTAQSARSTTPLSYSSGGHSDIQSSLSESTRASIKRIKQMQMKLTTIAETENDDGVSNPKAPIDDDDITSSLPSSMLSSSYNFDSTPEKPFNQIDESRKRLDKTIDKFETEAIMQSLSHPASRAFIYEPKNDPLKSADLRKFHKLYEEIVENEKKFKDLPPYEEAIKLSLSVMSHPTSASNRSKGLECFRISFTNCATLLLEKVSLESSANPLALTFPCTFLYEFIIERFHALGLSNAAYDGSLLEETKNEIDIHSNAKDDPPRKLINAKVGAVSRLVQVVLFVLERLPCGFGQHQQLQFIYIISKIIIDPTVQQLEIDTLEPIVLGWLELIENLLNTDTSTDIGSSSAEILKSLAQLFINSSITNHLPSQILLVTRLQTSFSPNLLKLQRICATQLLFQLLNFQNGLDFETAQSTSIHPTASEIINALETAPKIENNRGISVDVSNRLTYCLRALLMILTPQLIIPHDEMDVNKFLTNLRSWLSIREPNLLGMNDTSVSLHQHWRLLSTTLVPLKFRH